MRIAYFNTFLFQNKKRSLQEEGPFFLCFRSVLTWYFRFFTLIVVAELENRSQDGFVQRVGWNVFDGFSILLRNILLLYIMFRNITLCYLVNQRILDKRLKWKLFTKFLTAFACLHIHNQRNILSYSIIYTVTEQNSTSNKNSNALHMCL